MKNLVAISTLIIGMVITLPMQAQSKKERRAKIDSLKIAFFNQSLSLTDSEKAKFWPVYNDYNAQNKKIRKDFRTKYKKNDLMYMDENQANIYLKELNAMKEKELALYMKYQNKYLEFMSTKKVVMIYRTEKEWHQKLKGLIRHRAKARR